MTEQPETLAQQVRRVRKAILVGQVRAAVRDLSELREILDRLATMDPRDPQVEPARQVVQVLSDQLAARATRARRDLLGIEATQDQLAPLEFRDQLASVRQARRDRQDPQA
jgi:hypothetical protein